ncbi:hypothetical protein Tco_1012621 [Tanacetum coccineum]
MGDEHLDTIPSVENLVPIPSESKGISDDTCDMPVGEDSSTFDALNDHSEILSDSNDDGTSSDDNDFEDIEYVSLEEVNDVDQEEKEFDLEDILQIQDVILREKLLNISRLITNIESLNDNPTPDRVLKSPSLVEPDQVGLTSIVMDEISDNSTNDPLLELLEFESFHFDLSFPHTPPELPDVEISLIIETDAPVINNFDELNVLSDSNDDGTSSDDDDFEDIEYDCPDFEDSRVHGFVHSYIRGSYPQLHLGNDTCDCLQWEGKED